MLTYVLKRLLLMIPTLIGITIVVFAISHLAPGDPVEAEFGGGMGISATAGASQSMAERQRMIEARRKELGLDKPLPVQYFIWLGRVAKGDWGESLKYRVPVSEKIWDAIGVTLQLNIASILLTYIVSIPLGIHAAVRRGKLDERAAGITLFGLYSAPSFWVATILLFYFANPAHLQWWTGVGLHSEGYERLTYLGYLKDWAWNMVLPVICLTYASLAGLSRYARTGMLEIIRKDYIRTARAKGLSPLRVVGLHALRNALIPVVTVIGLQVGVLFTGAILTETIFSWPGVGKWLVESINRRDYPVLQGGILLIGTMVMAVNLVVDVLYGVINPRIRHTR